MLDSEDLTVCAILSARHMPASFQIDLHRQLGRCPFVEITTHLLHACQGYDSCYQLLKTSSSGFGRAFGGAPRSKLIDDIMPHMVSLTSLQLARCAVIQIHFHSLCLCVSSRTWACPPVLVALHLPGIACNWQMPSSRFTKV